MDDSLIACKFLQELTENELINVIYHGQLTLYVVREDKRKDCFEVAKKNCLFNLRSFLRLGLHRRRSKAHKCFKIRRVKRFIFVRLYNVKSMNPLEDESKVTLYFVSILS